MLLHSGSLYWPTTLPNRRTYPMLDRDISCDVLIVGGGESGAYCAYFLSDKGVRTVLIERQEAAGGSTSASTGLVQFLNDKPLISCIQSFGEEKAVHHYKLCKQAVGKLESIVSDLPFCPEFTKRESLYFASSNQDANMLEKEYSQLQKHGFPVAYFTEKDINHHYGFTKPAAIVTKDDAEINPYKLAHGMLEAACKRGVKIHEHTALVGKNCKKTHVEVLTNTKHKITAGKVIFAAGYEAQAIRSDKNAVLSSTYAIVTDPVNDFSQWHGRSLIWETDRPYLYMRTTEEGRIVVGGLDEGKHDKLSLQSSLISKRDRLLKELTKLFPQYEGIKHEFSWSGVFANTHDGLPIIGEYEEYPNCYFLLGYGGNGTVYSSILADILCEVIIKGTHPDLPLYLNNRPLIC